ncbi:Cytochrome P450 2J2 [Triplophysa tibetana]|uniref:Cytochrome P450 2J2 n=1 Tax=Triplophysa tibetana TaxID=1572043 RepID=A0A5A9NGY8_9TELE|nr:Cytochrome P450 2J2 [Triplophysa tibetana]
MVVVSGYKLVKEALVDQNDGFVERPNVPLFNKTFKGIGIALSNGYKWRMHRKFTVSHLRNFGEGKKAIELSIQQECVFLCDAFRVEKGPFNPQVILNSAISNIVVCLVLGQRFDYHDERYQNILSLDTECIQLAGQTRTQLYNVWPQLFEYLPGPHQTMFANYEKITDFLRGEIIKHREDWDPLNPRDYMDTYLTEMQKKKSDPEAGFNVEGLVVACLDLVEAGTETSTTTLRWGLLYMIKFPEIQEKVREEIDRVIGQSRQPCLADRVDMPYTDAVIHETQRFGNAVPLGFPKLAAKDTTLGEYFIPKGTALTTSLSSVLYDPDEWETPHTFNPQHFLDDKGQFRKRDAFLPFSAGKRACLGEQLARMELFLFFTSLLQQFTISKCPGEEPSLDGEIWFTYAPAPFRICLSPLLLLISISKTKNPTNFPPGPWALPFLGNIVTDVNPKSVDQLITKYGNIFGLRSGTDKIVYVSGYKMVKEVLITQGENFISRPISPLFDSLYKGQGISFNNGYSWRKQQQFAMSHLKNFGEGKKTLEEHLQRECYFLSAAFKEEQGYPFDPLVKINNAVANVMGTLVFGHRYEYDDVDFQKCLRKSAESVFLTGSVFYQLYEAFPSIMKWLPGSHQTIISNYKDLALFLKEKVEQHKSEWVNDNPKDYIDAYLSEIEKRKNDIDAGFTISSLVWCMVDLFEGGTETTTNTLRWALLYLIKYSDVQEKIHAEIEQVIGSRLPTAADKANMPYTNAVIHEVLRKANIVPLNMSRVARQDTTVAGYFIPKGTVMITNLTSVLFDKHEWESPDTFNPGHFLDSEGQFRRRNAFFAFSAGKRQCPGEYLAHIELFILLTMLLQTFKLSPSPGEEPSLESVVGFTQAPLPYKFCAHLR